MTRLDNGSRLCCNQFLSLCFSLNIFSQVLHAVRHWGCIMFPSYVVALGGACATTAHACCGVLVEVFFHIWLLANFQSGNHDAPQPSAPHISSLLSLLSLFSLVLRHYIEGDIYVHIYKSTYMYINVAFDWSWSSCAITKLFMLQQTAGKFQEIN